MISSPTKRTHSVLEKSQPPLRHPKGESLFYAHVVRQQIRRSSSGRLLDVPKVQEPTPHEWHSTWYVRGGILSFVFSFMALVYMRS